MQITIDLASFLAGFVLCYLVFFVANLLRDSFIFLDPVDLLTIEPVGFVLGSVFKIVGFIPITVWGMFRHWIISVPAERMERALKLCPDTLTATCIRGNTYLCRDSRAKCLHNKVFFVRIQNTEDKKES